MNSSQLDLTTNVGGAVVRAAEEEVAAVSEKVMNAREVSEEGEKAVQKIVEVHFKTDNALDTTEIAAADLEGAKVEVEAAVQVEALDDATVEVRVAETEDDDINFVNYFVNYTFCKLSIFSSWLKVRLEFRARFSRWT